MSNQKARPPSLPDATASEEGSGVRGGETEPGISAPKSETAPREAATRIESSRPARRKSDPTLPAPGSREDRLEQKLRLATELLAGLPADDARVRLISIARHRRDEVLLDGLLADLTKSRGR